MAQWDVGHTWIHKNFASSQIITQDKIYLTGSDGLIPIATTPDTGSDCNVTLCSRTLIGSTSKPCMKTSVPVDVSPDSGSVPSNSSD